MFVPAFWYFYARDIPPAVQASTNDGRQGTCALA